MKKLCVFFILSTISVTGLSAEEKTKPSSNEVVVIEQNTIYEDNFEPSSPIAPQSYDPYDGEEVYPFYPDEVTLKKWAMKRKALIKKRKALAKKQKAKSKAKKHWAKKSKKSKNFKKRRSVASKGKKTIKVKKQKSKAKNVPVKKTTLKKRRK